MHKNFYYVQKMSNSFPIICVNQKNPFIFVHRWLKKGVQMPTLYIISGCNGAGKTTASYSVLPDILQCREFVNADEIAKGLSPFNPSSVAIQAGRLMLNRIDELMSAQISFSVETTLSTRSYLSLIRQAQERGYMVSLIYFWLNSPELAIERVKQRVANGGHDIPPQIVRRRYKAGLNNFFKIYMHCVDYWMLADNSNTPRVIVADAFRRGGELRIYNESLYRQIKGYVN